MAMTNINIRIDADKKLKAQELFSSLGLDMTTAINLFIQQSLEFNGIPFTIRKYNAETEAAFAEVEEMKKHPELYKSYSSADELFEDLDKMKYIIKPTNQFKKDFKKIKKQNKDLNILKKVIDMLANDEILPDKYRDHLLDRKLQRQT